MTLSKREKLLLIILAVVVVIGGYFQFLFLPMMKRINESSAILEGDRATLIDLELYSETGLLTDKEKQIQEEILAIEQKLPTQVRIPEVFIELSNIAKSAGLEQQNLTMQNTIIETSDKPSDEENIENNEQEKDNLEENLLIIPISHVFNGSYKEIKNYIDSVQKSNRRIDIIEYQINKNDQEENLSARLLLHSYALVRDGQNYSEFTDYNFIKASYGKDNPFSDFKKTGTGKKNEKELENEDRNGQ